MASDIMDVTPFSLHNSHLADLSSSDRMWLKNVSVELFNATQAIFGAQIWPHANRLLLWVQNSEKSNGDLRFHFERTRGYSREQGDELSLICNNYEDISIEECEIFLDRLLPWLPDRPLLWSNMWPNGFNKNDISRINNVVGISSPYTRVIDQGYAPSGEGMFS